MSETKTRGAWHYRRWAGGELGRPKGEARGIARAHFHGEVQISAVTRGRRLFEVAGVAVDVPAGTMLVVPAGVAHRDGGGAGSATWAGFNLYLPAATIAWDPESVLLAPLPEGVIGCDGAADFAPDRAMQAGDLLAHARATGRVCPPAPAPRVSGFEMARAPSYASHRRGSKRATGITPQAARVAARANRARRMLGEGLAPAEVAAALGFADQAHLTRQFRLCFGTTPAAYRRAMIG